MIRIFSFQKNKLEEIQPDKLKKSQKITYWVDLDCSNSKEVDVIKDFFDIHPTAEEDILSNQTRIKYEEFEENTAIIFQGIDKFEALNIITYNLSFIFGENYLITSHFEKNGNIDYLINNPKKLEHLIKKGKDYVLHYILDKEVDKAVRIKSEIFEGFKQLERNFINNSEKESLKELFKKELMILETRQLMESVTDLCLYLTKPTDNYISENLLPYFRDVYDHSFKTTESLKSMLGRINGMRNAYQSITSNRLNETMRNLTVIMAIMMPLTLITGFYGMNIKLPFQNDMNIWVWAIVFMIVISMFMFFLFRKLNIKLKD
ncbi:MAG TPA: magnesium transporter CorA family protein [Candidatus Pacearchaeota archaeon]|nr:magnesium transporter CorA family protein [Candidatus Pacearchaeota archaeon]